MFLRKMNMLFLLSFFVVSCHAMNKTPTPTEIQEIENKYSEEKFIINSDINAIDRLEDDAKWLSENSKNNLRNRYRDAGFGIDNFKMRANFFTILWAKEERIFGFENTAVTTQPTWEKPLWYTLMTGFSVALAAFIYKKWEC